MYNYPKAHKILFFISLMIISRISVFAQTTKAFSINGSTRQDTAIIFIEHYIAEGFFCLNDSAQKESIFKVLDSLELHAYSLDLIESELDNIKSKNSSRYISLNTKKAFILKKTGKYNKARINFRKNITNSKNRFDDLYTINYGGLAILNFDCSEFDTALYYSDHYLNNALAIKDSHNIAEAYKLKGNIIFHLADYEKSLNEHLKAVPYCNSFQLASVYNEIGRDYFYLDERQQAFNHLEKSLSIKDSIGDKYGYCASLGNLGQLYYSNNNDIKALEYFTKCLELAKNESYLDLIAWINKSISSYYLREKKYKKALVYYQEYFKYNDSLIYRDNDVKYAVEKARSQIAAKENELLILKHQQEVSKLKLERTNYLIITLTLVLIIVLLLLFFIIYRVKSRTLALQQKIKRAQMDPHFVFNVLNILQEKILEGNTYESNKFLGKFSSLLRSSLEANFSETILLKDEIEFLKTYIELETLRFDNKFQFNFNIDAEIDLNSSIIPTMIIQPFIENAIWHGLINSESKENKLNIDINKYNKGFIFKIEDTGIGINKSINNKKNKNNQNKTSLGLKITKSRISDLSKIYKKEFNIDIVDKSDLNTGNGTIIKIIIPKI